MISRILTLIAAGFALAPAALAVSSFTETFTADSAAWRASDGATTLSWVASGGPGGTNDAHARAGAVSFAAATNTQLQIVARAHGGYDSSGDAFVGDWLSATAAVFSIDLRHDFGAPAAFGIRFASSTNFPGGVAVAPQTVLSGEWVTLVIPIDPENPGFTSFEGSSFAALFANIGNLQVLTYVPEGLGGNPGPFAVDLDNASLVLAGSSVPEGLTQTVPAYDRWMYPFNANSPLGSRPTASTFGAFADGFDQRDAQAYFGFILSNAIPAGLGPESYEIVSCVFSATMSDGSIVYDPTPDAWQTYLDPTQALYVADADTGRAVELFAAGFRGGYDAASFGEDAPFASTGGADYVEIRNVYPLGTRDGVPVDVSNNSDPDGSGTNGFDPGMLAAGLTLLTSGDTVPVPTTFTFTLDPDDAFTADYLRDALDQGILGLVLTSLHQASFGGPVSYPVWDQKESVVGESATLTLAYRILPGLSIAHTGDVRTVTWTRTGGAWRIEGTGNPVSGEWAPLTAILTGNETRSVQLDEEHDVWLLRLNQR
ncbi:MAG: hypothetical protein H7A43_07540 [Verrucomicrobia bacterium]|nr:hypothetical protein [Verrucomicrobiota bacterium]